MALVPAAATMVAGVDATSLLGSSTWAQLRPLVETGDVKTLVEIGQGCELGVSSWRGLTFASELSGSNTVVVMRADGIGRPERLECVRAAIERKDGKSPWKGGASANELALDGGGIAIATDPCTLVVASTGWSSAVRDRLTGGGSSAQVGALASAIGRVDARKPAWVAAAIPSGATTGSPFDGARDVVATIDVAGGLTFAMSFTFSDPAEATKRAGELQHQLDSMKTAIAGMGMPQNVLDSIRIVSAGAQVLLQANASDADVRSLTEKLAPMVMRP
ncbi:MAG TPA: hypothetical protein VG755_21480 [Nannocystaceae bacterium]|nr:hypothetical protein [Nannocystaceae bacterium]